MPKLLISSLLTLCICMLNPLKTFAQHEFLTHFRAKNAMYLEFSGNADTYSVNIERIVYQNLKFKTGLRVGVGTNLFFMPEEPELYPVVPVEAVGMIGRNKKHFEFGIGYTRRFTDDPDLLQNMYFTRLGFRYQVPRGGLLVRVAATPFITTESNIRTPGPALVPRFGLSVGRSF